MTARSYEEIKKECEASPHMRRDGKCFLNHFLKCNGFQCPSVHYFRETRPTNILANVGLEDEYKEDMREG